MGKDRPGRGAEEGGLDARDRVLYGRRYGRPLRSRGQDAVEALLPKLRVPLPDAGGLQPLDLFDADTREVWLEIGSGNGDHAIWQAERNRAVGLIAVEPFVNGIANLLAMVGEHALTNVRVLDDDARLLMGRLAPKSIARAFILFPDPWPKRRHWRRRIVCSAVLDQLACLMPDGAELRIATDDVAYLVWILREVQAHPAFAWAPRCADDWRCRPEDWPETRFEMKGKGAGRPPTFLSLRRRPDTECA